MGRRLIEDLVSVESVDVDGRVAPRYAAGGVQLLCEFESRSFPRCRLVVAAFMRYSRQRHLRWSHGVGSILLTC